MLSPNGVSVGNCLMRSISSRSSYASASRGSASSLFLLELIIAVGFFAVAGVVCIQMFLHAHRISENARIKAEAVTIVQNCAESFLAADGDRKTFDELLRQVFPEDTIEDHGSHTELISQDGEFRTEFSTEKAETGVPEISTLHILVSAASGEEICSLDVCDYPGEEKSP